MQRGLNGGVYGALMLAATLAANGALACPAQGKGWKDFSSLTLQVTGKPPMTVMPLSDGLHVKSESHGQRVELLQLNGGPTLHLGHDPAKGPSPLMFSDMLVGVALKPIAEHYGMPCGVPSAPVPFTWTGSNGFPSVSRGSVRWLDGSALAYELQLAQRAPDAPAMTLSGEIRFEQRQAAPVDMPLTGWIATRGGDPFKPDILPPAATLRELRERTKG